MENTHSVHKIGNFLDIVPACSEMLKTEEAAVVHFHEFKCKAYSNYFNEPLHLAI